MNKKCKYCETDFIAKRQNKHFCCKNCSKYHWNEVYNYKSKPNPVRKEYNCLYRENNKDKIKSICAQWYQENKEKVALNGKNYRKNNPNKVKNINKEYKQKHRIRNTQQARERYRIDLDFRLRMILRARLKGALKNNQKVGSAVSDLGCSVAKLKIHLQLKFYRNPRGKHEYMTWGNYGEWHIDHIEPLDSFNLSNRDEFLKACHYTNLQPLWAKDNLKKGCKI